MRYRDGFEQSTRVDGWGEIYEVTLQPLSFSSNTSRPATGYGSRCRAATSRVSTATLNTGGNNYDEVQGVVALAWSAKYPSQ